MSALHPKISHVPSLFDQGQQILPEDLKDHALVLPMRPAVDEGVKHAHTVAVVLRVPVPDLAAESDLILGSLCVVLSAFLDLDWGAGGSPSRFLVPNCI